jgi:MscS family membrane protein
VVLFGLLLLFSTVEACADARHPLTPLDTSSPRATFESFFALTEEAAQRISEYRASLDRATQAPVFRNAEKAKKLFDLHGLPPAAQREVAADMFYMLWEVVARLELPDPAEIPDESAVKEADETAKPLAPWRLPCTGITIVRIEEGPRAQEFRFSRHTVDGARAAPPTSDARR